MEQNPEEAPLATGSLAGSNEALVSTVRESGGNRHALKIAGLTTLACLLLGSQAFTAYFLINQRDQISNLERNTDNMRRDLGRRPQNVVPVQMKAALNRMPLLMDFLDGNEGKKPETKPEDSHASEKKQAVSEEKQVASVEQQVKDFLQNLSMPQLNDSLLANLQNLKKNMQGAEWEGFEAWLQNWLIFQVAMEDPPVPTTPTPRNLPARGAWNLYKRPKEGNK